MDEILIILSEECAEVIHAVAKCQRFGIDSKHPETGQTNKQRLIQEVGDVLALIQEFIDTDPQTKYEVQTAKYAKQQKLQKWSSLAKI